MTAKRVCTGLCPDFQRAMDVLSRPWNGLILAALEEGPLRFGALSERMEGSVDRMLSVRLKELQAGGLVDRAVIPGPPVRVEYALTPAGRRFREVSDAIRAWGATLPAAPAEDPEGGAGE